MKIFVSINQGEDQKRRGDLLEQVATELLESHDYVVDNEIRKTGMELDLLCKSRANPSRVMYVECKAYNDDKIQAGVIVNLVGRLHINSYKEAWLMTTSDLGKEAKGLVDDIKMSDQSDKFTFYTPKALIAALQSANVISSNSVSRSKIKEILGNETKMGETHLLISHLGSYWMTEYVKSGVIDGIIFSHAKSSEIIIDEKLIENFEKLDFKLNTYDLGAIFKVLDPNDKTIEGRRLRGAVLSEVYIAKIIAESGTTATASVRKSTAPVNDIFIYPDIEAIDINKKKESSELISSKDIGKDTTNKNWLMLGDDLAGKTTLSYMLQRQLVDSGRVVVRLSPDNLKNLTTSSVNKGVLKAFIGQYNVDGIPLATIRSYLEDARNNIILVIDDFDRIDTKKTFDAKLIKNLEKLYYKLIIFSNISRELEYTTSNEGRKAFEKFHAYKLLQLGHVKRDELIERWVTINSEDRLDSAQMLIRKDDFAKKINTAIGTNYLPTYPFYTIAILEMLESGNKAQLQGSEYVALYGHFINHALMSNKVKSTDLGFYNNYLSHLAYRLYGNRSVSISAESIKDFFVEYLNLMALDKPYDIVHQKLIASKILRQEDDVYFFNLSYYRYYFLAKYLSDNIETEETRRIIKNLVDNLHEEDNANTVIFLVHHSKNKEIVDIVIKKAKSQFYAIQPQTLLSDEITNINTLITEDMPYILRDGTATEHRNKKLKRQDDYERSKRPESKKDAEDDILDVYAQITSAFRTIDVLGKITSNYYGELNAVQKNLIMDELYELGFRSLRAFLESFDNYIDTLRAHIETKIDDKRATSESEKKKIANKIIYSFTHIITYSFIKRVSDSVVSPNLIITIEDVLNEKAVPAAKLTSVATKLNFPDGLEKHKSEIVSLFNSLLGNSLARDLLRFMILEHIYKFEIGYQNMESICSHLNIDVTAVRRRKLNPKNK